MSLAQPQRLNETRFNVVNVENSVRHLLVSQLMMAGPNQYDATKAEALLPVDQVVRLKKAIPELSLCCGESGVVISVWFAPTVAYEVEFYQPNENCRPRVLVLGEHLQAEPAEG